MDNPLVMILGMIASIIVLVVVLIVLTNSAQDLEDKKDKKDVDDEDEEEETSDSSGTETSSNKKKEDDVEIKAYLDTRSGEYSTKEIDKLTIMTSEDMIWCLTNDNECKKTDFVSCEDKSGQETYNTKDNCNSALKNKTGELDEEED